MRESCISHSSRQPMAVVREDYYLLMNRDCIAAALLNIFEYWANGAIAFNPNEENPWLGVKTTKDFEEMLLGMATDKHIRKRLHQLEELGFIETRQPVAHRKSFEFRFMVSAVQKALKEANGQTTVGSGESQRSNDRRVNGQTTVGSGESQRSNDRCTIYKKDQDQEEFIEEEDSPTPHAIIVEQIFKKPRTEDASKQILCDDETTNTETRNSALAVIDGANKQIFPPNENNNQSFSLSQKEIEVLKQAQNYAFNPAIAPWRDGATLINSSIQKAIFDANPPWYSTDSGLVNLKKINDRIKSLERQMRGTGVQAIEAYTELMNYVSMAHTPNSAQIVTMVSNGVKKQSVENNLKAMLSDRLSQKGVNQ